MKLTGIWWSNGKYNLELQACSDLHANEFATHEYERFPGYDIQTTRYLMVKLTYRIVSFLQNFCKIFTNLLDFILHSYSSTFQRPGKRSPYSDSVRAGREGNRIPIGARSSATVQTGHRAHPASCTMVKGPLSGGGGAKLPGRGDYPHLGQR